tara:strand:- start:326 stop:1219 length:894 start_codon:yes stop_codon:yes gene_type:complete
MFKRIFLFLLTNLLVLVLLGIVLNLIGFTGYFRPDGSGFDYGQLLLFSAVFGFLGSFVSLAMSKFVAKRMTGAQVITQARGGDEAWLLATVERLAGRAGIGTPEVAIFPSKSPNAFATGARRNHALVAVSVGLLQTMSKDEVEAVLAHEVAHVANGDMITMALMQGVMNTFVIFLARVLGLIIDRVVLRNREGLGLGYFVTRIVLEIVLSILASVVVMWFSRKREFRADAGAAALVGAPPMIAALRRLGSGEPSQLPASMAAFGIKPRPRRGLAALFSSHPSIDERIVALESQRAIR